jgi:hypothetical protein
LLKPQVALLGQTRNETLKPPATCQLGDRCSRVLASWRVVWWLGGGAVVADKRPTSC